MINLGKREHVFVYMFVFHMVTGADVCNRASRSVFDKQIKALSIFDKSTFVVLLTAVIHLLNFMESGFIFLIKF